MIPPDLDAAAVVVEQATVAVETAARHLAAGGGPDEHQVLAYDLAHAAASIECGRAALDYGSKGEVEATLACVFVADALHDLLARTLGREDEWGTEPGHLDATLPFVRAYRSPGVLADLAGEEGRRLARDQTRDPHPGPREGRYRRAEAAVAPQARQRRGHGGGGGHRAGLRLGRRRDQGHRRARRRWLGDRRGEDLVHVRGARRR